MQHAARKLVLLQPLLVLLPLQRLLRPQLLRLHPDAPLLPLLHLLLLLLLLPPPPARPDPPRPHPLPLHLQRDAPPPALPLPPVGLGFEV